MVSLLMADPKKVAPKICASTGKSKEKRVTAVSVTKDPKLSVSAPPTKEGFPPLPKGKRNAKNLFTTLRNAAVTEKSFTGVVIPIEEIVGLIEESIQIIKKQASLIDVTAPINVCGDIHAQFADLLRVFQTNGWPPEHKYLFLGDYVDRGPFPVEVVCLLLCLVIRNPQHVLLLRGNHEIDEINRRYGFYDVIIKLYKNESLYWYFNELFDYLPLAALISERIFCCHGGLSPHLTDLNQIRNVKRPVKIPKTGLLTDILWSDPDAEVQDFKYNTTRGISVVFGIKQVEDFLAKLDLDLICRAHQVVADGYEFFAGRGLVTIFTAPNYCGEFDNAGAILNVDANLVCSMGILRPLRSINASLEEAIRTMKAESSEGKGCKRQAEA